MLGKEGGGECRFISVSFSVSVDSFYTKSILCRSTWPLKGPTQMTCYCRCIFPSSSLSSLLQSSLHLFSPLPTSQRDPCGFYEVAIWSSIKLQIFNTLIFSHLYFLSISNVVRIIHFKHIQSILSMIYTIIKYF